VVDGDAYLQKVIPTIGTFPQREVPIELSDRVTNNPFVQSVLGLEDNAEDVAG